MARLIPATIPLYLCITIFGKNIIQYIEKKLLKRAGKSHIHEFIFNIVFPTSYFIIWLKIHNNKDIINGRNKILIYELTIIFFSSNTISV